MQYSAAILSVLAATGAIALPTTQQTPPIKGINVFLRGDNVDVWQAVGFKETSRGVASSQNTGPFKTAELKLGADVNRKDLRCKILDENGAHIVVTRGANIDTTLGDGNGGPWTITKGPRKVTQVVCDPSFVKVSPDDVNTVRVILSDERETGAQVAFNADQVKAKATADPSQSGPFTIVTLQVGPNIDNQGLRCKALDKKGNALRVKRGENRDVTFGDAGKGAWTFIDGAASVDKIVCDPSFKKATA